MAPLVIPGRSSVSYPTELDLTNPMSQGLVTSLDFSRSSPTFVPDLANRLPNDYSYGGVGTRTEVERRGDALYMANTSGGNQNRYGTYYIDLGQHYRVDELTMAAHVRYPRWSNNGDNYFDRLISVSDTGTDSGSASWAADYYVNKFSTYYGASTGTLGDAGTSVRDTSVSITPDDEFHVLIMRVSGRLNETQIYVNGRPSFSTPFTHSSPSTALHYIRLFNGFAFTNGTDSRQPTIYCKRIHIWQRALEDVEVQELSYDMLAPLKTSTASYFLPASSGGTALVVADATHAHNADSLALSQAHTLAAQDATHAQSADNLTLTQTHGLAVADATHSHTADSLTLVPQGSLSVQDATHSHTADSLALTQTHALAVADATHAHAADNVDLTENTDLVVQGANHAHSADSVALTQTHNLNVADSTHSHTADALTLVVTSAALNISDATHGHTADVVDFSGDVPAGGKGSSKAKRYPRRVMIEGRVSVVSNPREERQLLKQYRQALEARKAAAEGKGNEIAAKRASVAIKRTETRIDNTFDYAAAWDAYLQAEDEELLLLLYG